MKTFAKIIMVIFSVVLLSLLSVKIQGHKGEGEERNLKPVINDTMTVLEFSKINKIPDKLVNEMFALKNKDDFKMKISQLSLSIDNIESVYLKTAALRQEYESRNWIKIPLKFLLTIIMLSFVFKSMVKKKITPSKRITLLGISIFVFGILLGSDPNPMGTVKDAIVLYGTKHIVFPPRMIAFVVFLLMVIVANKFICSWGCQFGTLQDLIFRLAHSTKNKNNKKIVVKVPFLISNFVRIAFLTVIVIAAFTFTCDIAGQIDPFKIYNPGKIGIAGMIFLGLILLLSMFIYRPWCHFFCPFGLVGWIVEKFSLYRIVVNRSTCVKCQRCKNNCPSTVMGAILEERKVIPDCFSCGSCIEACPSGSVSFKRRGGVIPEEGKEVGKL